VIDNSRANARLSATNASPKPGDDPLGSTEFWVAARALADRLTASGEVLRVVVEHIGSPERNQEFVIPLKAR
jgi:hypothetical protein